MKLGGYQRTLMLRDVRTWSRLGGLLSGGTEAMSNMVHFPPRCRRESQPAPQLWGGLGIAYSFLSCSP